MGKSSKKASGKKLLFGISILILFLAVGISYLLLPLEAKIQAHLDFGLSQGWHTAIAIMILLLGGIAFVLALTTELVSHVNKLGRKYWFIFILFDVIKYIVIVIGAFFILAGSYGTAQFFIP